MPRITPNPTESPAAEPSRKASPRPSGPSAAPPRLDRPAPRPARKGALFRALVRAGCDPDAAYNAETEIRSMAAENLVAQLGAQFQVGFMEIKQICRENAERIAEQGRKLDALAEAGVERDRKIDALAKDVKVLATDVEVLKTDVKVLKTDVEVLKTDVGGLRETTTARTDALGRELRLIWGALGLLVTVLLAVFGFLFTR